MNVTTVYMRKHFFDGKECMIQHVFVSAHRYAVAGTAHQTPLLCGPLSCFFTLEVHLYHTFPAVVSFPSFHVKQIWHDNLLHVTGARCSRGVTQKVHFISALIA